MKRRLCLFFHMICSVWLRCAAEDTEVLCDYLKSCVLPCSFEAGPEPIINWLKETEEDIISVYSINNGQLQFQEKVYAQRTSLSEKVNEGDASLLLKDIRVHDDGTYQCVTSTKANSVPSGPAVRLRVRAPVLEVSLDQEGQQLLCRSERMFPRPAVTWTPSIDPNTTVSERDLFSVVSSVTPSDSENTYTCNISTEFDWRSATYRNNPEVLFSDAAVTVFCTELTAPIKSLIWKFNNDIILTRTGSEPLYRESWKPFVEGLTKSNSLVLKDLTQNHQGSFSCELSTESQEFIIKTELIKAQPPKDGELPPWVSPVVGGVVALVSIVILIFCCCYWCRKCVGDYQQSLLLSRILASTMYHAPKDRASPSDD